VADIFISFTSSDRDWAFWIANELEALEHIPHVHEFEVNAGDDIYRWMEERLDAADHVLCVVSDEYLKAPYSTLERNAALWQAVSKRPAFVLPVVVKPCKLPALMDHIRRCELFGVPEDAARIRFREFMSKREAPAVVSFPGKVFAVSNIPIHIPKHFMGRDDALVAIEAALKRYEGRVAITALHGLRGVGKTTLAATYAERHREDYRATWWIRAQTQSTMRADLVALGVRLGWVMAEEKEEPALAAVMERLRHEGEGILLIYDNAIEANTLTPYLPPGGIAQVLVTSNAHAWRGVAEPVEIRLWPKEIGADYLIARTGRRAERTAAEALSMALDGLPLAHEQAAAYCEDLGIGFAEYQLRFDRATIEFLDGKDYVPVEYHPDHTDRLTVARTFHLAIEQAAKRHPGAEPLIVHAALLAPEPIPLFLFLEAGEKFGRQLGSALAGDGLDKAIAALRAFALIGRECILDERDPSISTNCIRLHRLVRQVAAARPDRTARDIVRSTLIEALVTVSSGDVWRDPHTWPRMRRLDPLMLPLIDGDAVPDSTEKIASELMMVEGQYKTAALAAYAQAEILFERALAIRERLFGSDHVSTAAALDYLARVVRYQGGSITRAKLLHERALQAYEKALGPNDPNVARVLNNLGRLLELNGDLTGARPLYQRALEIRESVLGPEHPDTATSLDNLSSLLQMQNQLNEALRLQKRALTIREKVLGQEHPHTANSLSSLGLLEQAQGNLAAASKYFERALIIREKILGADHPHTATSLKNLGVLRMREKDIQTAQDLLARALNGTQKTLGSEHPETNILRTLLAEALLVDKAADALALGQTALAEFKKTVGSDHLWTKDSAHVTADALDALGRADEAAELRQQYGLQPR
jgi:tetratricopeptide (TPR) repeat protein